MRCLPLLIILPKPSKKGAVFFPALKGQVFTPKILMKKLFNTQKIHFVCISLVMCFGFTMMNTADVDSVPRAVPAGMVLIPAGEFQMGSDDAQAGSDEKPVHRVYLDAFYMDTYEVTNAEYAAFLNAKGKHVDGAIKWFDLKDSDAHIEQVDGRYQAKSGYEDHPVIEVSWYGAMAYAAWVGKRLPTEAEWEKAARGGLAGQKYAWGNTINPSKANYLLDVKDTVPVGSYPPNGYGLYDMTGNVWEWCLDAYDSHVYTNSPRRNPIVGAERISELVDNFMAVKSSRVLRGGSWFYSAPYLRVSYRDRDTPRITYTLFGFRCVKEVAP